MGRRLAEGETHRLAWPHSVEQFEALINLPERVERAIASGLLYEDADQAPGCEKSDISSDERGPGLLDPDLEGREEATHARLNVDPAVDRENPHDGADRKR